MHSALANSYRAPTAVSSSAKRNEPEKMLSGS